MLQKRERAHVIDTLETRCTERSQLAIFRILDAQHLKALDEAYKTSLAMKDNLVYLLGQMEKDDKGLGQFVDLEALKAEVNKAAFSLAIVDRTLKPADDVRRSEPQYQAAAKAVVDKLKETSKPYVDQLAAQAQMRAEAQKKLGKESPLFSDVDVLERRLRTAARAAQGNTAEARYRPRRGIVALRCLDRSPQWRDRQSGSRRDRLSAQ